MSVFIALLIPVITIANITFHQQTLAERLAFIFTFILLGTGLSLAYLWKPLKIELNNEFLIVKRKIGDKKFPLASIHSAAFITKKELVYSDTLKLLLKDYFIPNGIDFTFDPNAENIYSQLRKSTSLPQLPLISEKRTLVKSNRNFDPETYLKLQLLRLELRVKREEETFMPFNALGTAGDIAMLNSPLSDGGGVKTIKDISKSLYQTYWLDDPDLYERAAGPYVFQEADKNKVWNLALKSIGLSGSLIDPATSIERENSDFFN
jgi:hypothetical protein